MRHAQALNNTKRILAGRTEGFPLTDEGRKQAESTAGILTKMGVDHIYASPIQRAQDTASIISEPLGIKPVTDQRLTEIDAGKFTGMKFSDIYSEHKNIFTKFYEGDVEIAHQGVETFAQLKSRVGDIMNHVVSEHAGKRVVLVTHMDPIKAALSLALDIRPGSLLGMIIANASLNVLKDHEGSLSLKAINLMEPHRFDQTW